MLLGTALAAKDQIEILLKEYDTLCAEILVRTTGGYQLIVVGAILFTALLTVMATRSAPSSSDIGRSWLSLHTRTAFWVCLCVLIAFGCVFSWAFRRDINIIAERLQRIEHQVNGLAGTDLLEWETKWGAKSTGWFPRHAPKSN
jgi:hypothetical protein